MRAFIVVTAIAACGTSVCAAEPRVESVDLTSIPRTIKVQPANMSASPTYCLVVFGQKAEHRVWLVRDVDYLFIDRNGDGELTEEPLTRNKHGQFSVDLLDLPGSPSRYSTILVTSLPDGTYRIRVTIAGRGLQYAGAMSSTRPKFGDRPETAPVIHFDGQMTLGQYGPRQTLPRSTKGLNYRKTSLKLMIGTPGLGEGTFAAFHCKCRRNKTMRCSIAYSVGEDAQYVERVSYKMHG